MAPTDPHVCPFCGEELPSPGTGFMNHIDESSQCAASYETWRTRLQDDLIGGWPG